ncbi:hypothetical protein LCGC14_2846210 [marine sediment metagenome]|uniref:Uncharacterized protein n=1 Tax=marine sediment metagenome TaxID=412755 RepID=A0A0F9B0S7_9ZZZZ
MTNYGEKILKDFLTFKSLHEYELRKSNELKRLKETGASQERIIDKKKIIKFVKNQINNI